MEYDCTLYSNFAAFVRTIEKKPRFLFYTDVIGMDINGETLSRGTELTFRYVCTLQHLGVSLKSVHESFHDNTEFFGSTGSVGDGHFVRYFRKSVTLGYLYAKSQFVYCQNVRHTRKSVISESGTSENLCIMKGFRNSLGLLVQVPLSLNPHNHCLIYSEMGTGGGWWGGGTPIVNLEVTPIIKIFNGLRWGGTPIKISNWNNKIIKIAKTFTKIS